MLVDEDRIAVGVGEHQASGSGGRFVDLGVGCQPLRLEPFLKLADNRAIDHVTNNLASPLKLKDVARVACFSPHHFHRIFRALVGETLATFVKRVRLERVHIPVVDASVPL